MSKCLILYNQPSPDALNDELDVINQVNFVEQELVALGYNVSKQGITSNFKEEIEAISPEYDFVFNLTEALYNFPELIYFIPSLLNLYKIPYSGCPVEATFATASKVYAKQIMQMANIPTIKSYKVSESNLLSNNKKYICKPIWEDGSVGITEESVFMYNGETPSVLLDKDDNHWFIEDYIEGREFNVSVIAIDGKPVVLPTAEMLFIDYPKDLPKIVSYKAKWNEESFQYNNSQRSFVTTISPSLANNIKRISLECWNVFKLKGYARIDLRSDTANNVYVMEVNANPCISSDSGFVAACRHYGMKDFEIIKNIISDLNTFTITYK